MALERRELAPRRPSAWLVCEILILIAAAAVRIWAAQDAFWFDEIWSLLSFAQVAASPADIFRFHHDNNHHLVTAWMWLCGLHENWVIYRVPSLVAGTATVGLAAWIARAWGTWAALAASLITASSFVLITYASEARGYALAGCFALAGYIALERFVAGRGWLANLGFIAAVVLGFLSHLTFLFFYAGSLTWSILALWRTRTSAVDMLFGLARLHLIPGILLVAFYLFDLRQMIIGGADSYVLSDVLVQILSLAVGGSGIKSVDVVLALLVLGGALSGIFDLWRRDAALAAFFLTTIFVAPTVMLVVRQPDVLFPRYFYVSYVFLLLLASYVLARVFQSGRVGRWVAALTVALVVLANARPTAEFLRLGRGQYLPALAYMADNADESVVDLQTDRDFETRFQLVFYRPLLEQAGLRLAFRPQPADGPAPEWAVVYSSAHPCTPPQTIVDPQQRPYELRRVFPYAGLSGYHWAVYHRVDKRSIAQHH